MYRPSSRYDSRIQDKPSRSVRSTWGDNRGSFSTSLEADDGTRSTPYVTEESMLDRDFQGLRGSNNDLREAQRLAASFFSSQVPPPSSTPVYRDARPTRTMSPEAPMDRFGSQSSRHYRERDANDDQRWASNNRSTSQERYLSTRSLGEPEVWEEVDAYGVPANRGRKREDNYGWEEVDLEYATRKGVEYPMHGETEAVRVTKRVDWTGLFRDGSEVGAAEASIGKRANPGFGGRPYGESYLSGQDELMDPEEAGFSNRSRDPHDTLRKRRGYIDDVPDVLEDYGPGNNIGPARGIGRGGQRDTEWSRDGGRHEERDYWHSGTHGVGMNEVSEIPRGFAEGPSTFQPNRGNASMGRRGMMNPKPDYSVRASLTNRDILGYYYGNSTHQPRKEFNNPRRGGASYNARFERVPQGGASGPWHGASRPSMGIDREKEEWGPLRKGKKRWPRSPRGGDGPHVSHTSHGKRFKRETEADKLFLMHNSKATSVPCEDETREILDHPRPSEKGKEKGERMMLPKDDLENNPAPEKKPTEKGLWDNDDSWSDSEEEKGVEVDVSQKNEDAAPAEVISAEVLEQAADQVLPPAVSIGSKELAESPVAAIDAADNVSLASEMDDPLNTIHVEHGVEADGTTSANIGSVAVHTSSISGQSEQAEIEKDAPKDLENEDSEMVEADQETGEGPRVEVTADVKIFGGAGEKTLVSEVLSAADAVAKAKEDKAYEFYVSVFDQDAVLRKLYETNVNSGSFECLVCAGIGAKKKKRFPDVASMVQHAKKILRTKKLPEHRGFARAVCHILGWDATASSPSSKTTVPRGWVASPEHAMPTLQPIDVAITQVSSNAAADANWDLESARRLLEEQLKELGNDPSSPLTLVQTEGIATSREIILQETGKEADTGDAPTIKSTVIGSPVHGVRTSVLHANRVNCEIAPKSFEDSTKNLVGRPEAIVSGKPTATSTTDDPDGSGKWPVLGENDGTAKTVQSSMEDSVGGAAIVTSGFPVSQGTTNECSKHPAAEVLSNEGVAVSLIKTKVEGEVQTRTSVAPASVSKDAGISCETETVGRSTSKMQLEE